MKERTHASVRQSGAEQEGTSHRPERDDDMIQHYALMGILPQGHILAVHPPLGIIAHLTYEAGVPHIQNMHHFGAIELLVLLPLLQQYPRYCPSELLLAFFLYTRVDDQAVARAREQLAVALREGTWEEIMKPIRDVLSRIRPRLHDLGIRIVSRRIQGYQLLAP